jgi:hypothetical protein
MIGRQFRVRYRREGRSADQTRLFDRHANALKFMARLEGGQFQFGKLAVLELDSRRVGPWEDDPSYGIPGYWTNGRGKAWCEECGQLFRSKRSDARFCSDAHRMRATRKRVRDQGSS